MSWLISLSIVTSWSDANIVYNTLMQIMRIIAAERDLVENSFRKNYRQIIFKAKTFNLSKDDC